MLELSRPFASRSSIRDPLFVPSVFTAPGLASNTVLMNKNALWSPWRLQKSSQQRRESARAGAHLTFGLTLSIGISNVQAPNPACNHHAAGLRGAFFPPVARDAALYIVPALGARCLLPRGPVFGSC